MPEVAQTQMDTSGECMRRLSWITETSCADRMLRPPADHRLLSAGLGTAAGLRAACAHAGETTMKRRDQVGVIHGRFQPLHNGHMEDYVLPAIERCEHLITGIANPDPMLTARHPANPRRAEPTSNPFTYYERTAMLRSTLLQQGVEEKRFTIVPFPINRPELLRYYVPFEATFYLTIYDDWGRYKKELLESQGLRVEVFFVRPQTGLSMSATRVRELMAAGGDWKPLVPEPVAEYIVQNHLDESLQRLLSGR